MNKIYEMKLHESLYLDKNYIEIVRVPGGWLYNMYTEIARDISPLGYNISSVFVPFNNEFQVD